MSDAEWAKVVEAANKEGEVTVYGAESNSYVTALPVAFHKSYPKITLTYVRMSPADMEARLGAEIASGNVAADAFDNLQDIVVDDFANKGALVPLAFPALAAPQFDREATQRTPYAVNYAVGPYAWAWNTKLLPRGIQSWQDYLALNPSMVGATDPSIGSAIASLYMATEQPNTGGVGFLDKFFAKGHPRVYPGSNPAVASLAAGEVAALLPIPADVALSSRASGAPIDFKIYDNAYAIRSQLGLTKGSKHPNAAQVFANWLVSKDGQLFTADQGGTTVLPGVPQAFDTKGITFVMDEPLPKDAFIAFQRRWNALMTK